MVNQLRFAKRFLSLVTPIVTSSALAPLALSIAASPGMAATLAFSEASFNLDNFSHNPQDVLTLTDTNTVAIATSGEVATEADAFADFITNPLPPSASNSSFSAVNGDGSDYFGLAESEAGVIGYNFLVEGGETFSFDFKAALDLETSIDEPQSEVASAAGDLTLELYDSTNPDKWIPLDSFTLSGALTTPGDDDFLDYRNSASITFNPSETSFDSAFGGTKEFANASVQGSFSRIFDSETSLTLVEAKNNQASTAVPEPASTAALLFCLTGLGYKIRNKAFGAK